MRLGLGFALVLLGGCAGHVRMQPIEVKEWRTTMKSKPVNGVVVFGPRYMLITHTFTSLVDPNENTVLGTGDTICKPQIQKQEMQVMPDFGDAYLISMTGRLLTSNKFGVTLANGVLTGVNLESASQIPATVGSVAPLLQPLLEPSFAGPERGAVTPGKDTPCNAEPKVTMERYDLPAPPPTP